MPNATRPRGIKRWVALSLALLLATPLRVHAEPTAPDQASAETLFEDAMKLVADHQYATACPKLEQSQSLDPAIGTQFRLAECYEALGKTASAWTTFIQVAELASATGQTDRERVARERASKVEPRLSRLTLVVDTPDIAGLEIRRGDVAIVRAQWGKPVPVDPSEYVITASAPGRVSWTGHVTVSGDGQSPTLSVPAPAEAEPTRPALRNAPTAGGTAPDSGPVGGPQRTIGLLVAGAGLVSVGVGSVFGAVAISDKNTAESSGCIGNHCTASSGATRDQARNAADLSTGFLVAGGALLAGGITLWLVSPHPDIGSTSGVGVGIRPGGMILRGTW